jgi:tRNA/tmRNA/rRNA uracil-C5-methylase (TrmA/RlmC/RlmD family)
LEDATVLRMSGAATANALLRPTTSYPNPHLGKEQTSSWMDGVARGDGSMLLVDPPRSGLDDTSLELITSGRFDRVLYVSCNQETLFRDLAKVARARPFSEHTARVVGAESDASECNGFQYAVAYSALFDQFPSTPHAECAVLLVRPGAPRTKAPTTRWSG